MKRLEDSGENPREMESMVHENNNEQVEQSIVIRMKDHDDYLGMFEYKKEAEQKIFKALIYGKNFNTNLSQFEAYHS